MFEQLLKRLLENPEILDIIFERLNEEIVY